MTALTFDAIASWVLITLSLLDWWATIVVWRLWRAHRDVAELSKQRNRFLITTLGASAIAILALNLLLSRPLPQGAGFVLLVLALVLNSGPCLYWLIDYYWR